MQCHEFETMRCWLGARLRGRDVNVRDDDLVVADALTESGLGSVAEVIALREADIEAIASRILGRPHVAA